jgi:Fe-S-cluster containining protein
MPGSLPSHAKKLVQIVDAALLDAEWRSGEWLICKPGCTPCCIGVFAIDPLDVLRLQEGLATLDATDPERAARIRKRSLESWERLAQEFPGDPHSGILADDDEAAARFEEFADYEPCPALDPDKGTCDVYAWRPITCRVFGPPVRSEGGLGVCELCYHGASTDEIATCELKLEEATELQERLVAEVEKTGFPGRTIVTFALAHPAAVAK